MLNKIKTCLLVVVCSTIMLGCCTPVKEVVIKTEVKVITTPDILLKPCKVTKPALISEYMSKTPQDREIYLSNYVSYLLTDLKLCNDQVKSIGTFQENEAKIVNFKKE